MTQHFLLTFERLGSFPMCVDYGRPVLAGLWSRHAACSVDRGHERAKDACRIDRIEILCADLRTAF
ncbi:hypothetical protein RSSM_03013 [Rhodopirellula sallentina SM41]|uniref:Uncharacterized protein n=1 Tax=Rhodopirellula sallentina SM41 TaxID=1263870 RepID=M5UHP6_9BACT|nr:hypothetical protein RSSM_03013 [Rhodopirellula sallentina SM41]